MTPDEFVAALATREPRTLRALEELSGPIGLDVDGEDWFGGFRPPIGSGTGPISGVLDKASIDFDPFRGAEADPALASLRLTLPLSSERARGVLERVLGPAQEGTVEGEPAHRFGRFFIREFRGGTLLDWKPEEAETSSLPCDPVARDAFLARLPAALGAALDGPALRDATAPPPAAGFRRTARPCSLREGGRLVPARVPRVELAVEPAADARAMAKLWGIPRPMAISTDVRQQLWWMLTASEPSPSPNGGLAVAATRLQAGRWEVGVRLRARPSGGPPPTVRAGASPAYDVWQHGGEVVALEIEPRQE